MGFVNFDDKFEQVIQVIINQDYCGMIEISSFFIKGLKFESLTMEKLFLGAYAPNDKSLVCKFKFRRAILQLMTN